MTEPVKPRRRYQSERRREQAEETRSRVLESAARLFRDLGYEGTSIAAIAEEAGVSAETVYARFGTKRALIGEVVRQRVRGDDARPVPEQDTPRTIAAETDQRRQLRLFANDVAGRLERAAPLVVVVSDAARSQPELAELLARLHEDRLRNLRGLVDAMAANGPLRVSGDEALETVWALSSPELHQLLVRVRGWDGARYRGWLERSLVRLLLTDEADEAPSAAQ